MQLLLEYYLNIENIKTQGKKMLTVNKYGEIMNLTSEVLDSYSNLFTIKDINPNKKLIINVPEGSSFSSSLNDNDVVIEFKDENGNVFEVILKNLVQILGQNDGDTIVEIVREDSDEVLASISDLNTALEVLICCVKLSFVSPDFLKERNISCLLIVINTTPVPPFPPLV